MSLEETLSSVWRQVLVEEAQEVKLNSRTFSVQPTPRKALRQVDFYFDDILLRGLEQNPATCSRWAQLAREGHKVMQFLCEGRYIGNFVDGKVTLYKR